MPWTLNWDRREIECRLTAEDRNQAALHSARKPAARTTWASIWARAAKAILGLTSPLLDPDAVMNNHQKDGIAETIVDLLELMLDSEPETTETPHHSAATLQRVRDFMRNNLADHELTPGTVAKSAGISVRYLHKLYAGSGITFGKALLAMRLEKANQLTKTDHCHATLQQIAFACGFNSQSHFSTAFKAHFGISPSLARNKTI